MKELSFVLCRDVQRISLHRPNRSLLGSLTSPSERFQVIINPITHSILYVKVELTLTQGCGRTYHTLSNLMSMFFWVEFVLFSQRVIFFPFELPVSL